jgi:hypothetical protein
LIKAYTSERAKFSGDSYEESLLTIRRRFFTLCKMLNVHPLDACEAAHLPFTGTALEYYHDSLQATAQDIVFGFDRMRDRFQTADVQDLAFAKWQCITFASVRTAEHADEYDRVLFQTGQKIHRALPAAYEVDIHLRDFHLRACAEKPFVYRIPEKPASTSFVSSSLPQSRDMKVISSESRRTQGASFSPRAQMSGSQMKPISIQRRT